MYSYIDQIHSSSRFISFLYEKMLFRIKTFELLVWPPEKLESLYFKNVKFFMS